MTETELYEKFEDFARRISEINRKVDFIMTELKLDYAQPGSNEFNEIRKLLKANKKIEAIKVYQSTTMFR
jgi:tetrahydromethanopterin S-methyltransferase subunit G